MKNERIAAICGNSLYCCAATPVGAVGASDYVENAASVEENRVERSDAFYWSFSRAPLLPMMNHQLYSRRKKFGQLPSHSRRDIKNCAKKRTRVLYGRNNRDFENEERLKMIKTELLAERTTTTSSSDTRAATEICQKKYRSFPCAGGNNVLVKRNEAEFGTSEETSSSFSKHDDISYSTGRSLQHISLPPPPLWMKKSKNAASGSASSALRGIISRLVS